MFLNNSDDRSEPKSSFYKFEMKECYNDDAKIMNYSSAYLEGQTNRGNGTKDFIESEFDKFYGCYTLFEFQSDKPSNLTLNYQANMYAGKTKLVIVTSEQKVILLDELLSLGLTEDTGTITLPTGKNTIKLVGMDSGGIFGLTLKGDATNNISFSYDSNN